MNVNINDVNEIRDAIIEEHFPHLAKMSADPKEWSQATCLDYVQMLMMTAWWVDRSVLEGLDDSTVIQDGDALSIVDEAGDVVFTITVKKV